ncbi:MAG TPA: iron ABC transporter permease, partial [Firmicutes bacterium]|nr:iron ABC transporter permease [Bacillota bacterium]
YAMALSLGDLTAVLVLGRGDSITIPVAIYRLIGHYQFTEATALGGIYILIALLLLIGFETVNHRDSKKMSRQ